MIFHFGQPRKPALNTAILSSSKFIRPVRLINCAIILKMQKRHLPFKSAKIYIFQVNQNNFAQLKQNGKDSHLQKHL